MFGVTKRDLVALLLAAAALALAGCPDVPNFGPLADADASGAGDDVDVFVPLSLDRLVDSVGAPQGGERVAIYGAGIQPGAVVRFGVAEAPGALVLSDGRINVDVPPGRPGLVDVTVLLPDGQAATLTDAYLYRGPLEIEEISPATGPKRGGVPLTIRGHGFDATTRVFIGDRAVDRLEAIDAQTLVGTLPARLIEASAVVDVVVSDGFEQRALDDGFRYVDPIALDWLYPTAGAVAGGTEVTLYGRGFEAETVVRVGGVVAETVVPGHGASMTIRTPPGEAGPVDLLVTGTLDSFVAPAAFAYVDPDSPSTGPRALHLWPARGPLAGGTQVALAPAFRYHRALAIDAVDPAIGSASGGEETIVRGRGFTRDGVHVLIGGAAAEVLEVGVATVTVRTPPGAPGRVDVEVFDDDDRYALLPAAYEYRADGASAILAITPGAGSRSGGRIVRVHGQGLRRASPVVLFGEARADDVRVVDDALLIVRAARGDVGRVNLRHPHLGLLAMAYEYFDPAQRYGGTSGGPIPEALNVTVLDQLTGEGVPEAFVILWDDLDTPYQGVTDDRGQLTFSDVGFGPHQMVTASADDYTTGSVVDFDARDVTIQLIPLASDPSGGGGGGGGPVVLDDSTLAGRVTGLDKYILPPPGDCEARLAVHGSEGSLCQVCEVDGDCPEQGARCVDLGEQGRRCATACATDDGCPEGYACRAVEHDAIQCLPAPGRRVARCSVTQPDVFAARADAAVALTSDEGVYQLRSSPGEYAVVCLGGYEELVGGAFTPTMMGVRRHVFALPGSLVAQQDVRLDIPLSRELRIRLDDAPIGRVETDWHTVDVFIDFGPDGVFLMPSRGAGPQQNLFELRHYPERFADSLYDASYTIYGAATMGPSEPATGEGSFTLHTAITEVDDDSVFELIEGGALSTSAGITADVFALAGDGADRALAGASDGKVLAFDGTFWALQQAPTEEALLGVWMASASDAWAVGARGGVFRWDGLRWRAVDLGVDLAGARWSGVHGIGDAVWLWGDAGVWRFDGVEAQPLLEDVEPGSVADVWADEAGAAWVVGAAGLLRRWRDGAVEVFDVEGADLNAVWGVGADAAWAVGDAGRILRWDGAVWFDALPVTARDLTAVHATGADDVWAVGEAGVTLRWDGLRWGLHTTIDHADLRGVWTTAGGRHLAAGLHTLVIGPFLRQPRPANPTVTGALVDLDLRWALDPGPDASFSYIQLQHESGLPFWTIMADGARQDIPLPDLQAAWGLQALWPGQGAFQIFRVHIPGFTMDAYDTTVLSQLGWRSWTIAGWGLSVEAPAR